MLFDDSNFLISIRDPSGHSMWLFDPDVSNLRKIRKFVVHIDYHHSAKVSGQKTGKVAIDEFPMVFPLDETQEAAVFVEFTDARQNSLEEMMPAKHLSAKNTKAEHEHAIIRGERKGTLVWHIRNDKDRARVYVEGTNKRKDGFFVLQTDLCLVERP